MPLSNYGFRRAGALLTLLALAACTGGGGSLGGPLVDPPPDGGTTAGDDDDDAPASQAYSVRGRVVGANGAPLANAEIVADNQALYDSNVVAISGADGRYSLELPEVSTTWAATASYVVDYHDRRYSFSLHPSDDTSFSGDRGAVRDFTWKLSGTRPDGGKYGGYVAAYAEVGMVTIEPTDIELTLEPDGPLVDGSTGTTITGNLVRTPDGDAITDVPVGRYRITARLPSGPLEVRLRQGSESYATSVTADFEPNGGLPIYDIDLEVRVP